MVLVELGLDRAGVDGFIAALAAQGVLAIGFGARRLRLCLHRGIEATDLAAIAAAFEAACAATGWPKQEN